MFVEHLPSHWGKMMGVEKYKYVASALKELMV